MLKDILDHYGLAKDLGASGYYETKDLKKVLESLETAVKSARMTALIGPIGSGKTTLARKLRQHLRNQPGVLVCTSLAVDKEKVNLNTLMVPLFKALAPSKDHKIPTNAETREQKLFEIVSRRREGIITLFVDDAHDLCNRTLVELKRLIEIVVEAGSILSVILIGHPKLKLGLRRSVMMEIGHRSDIILLEGIKGSERHYFEWLIKECGKPDIKSTDIFAEEAIDTLCDKFSTPLQIEYYARRAIEEAYVTGTKPVTREVLERCFALDLDSLEAQLIREGFNERSLAELMDIRPAEIRSFFRGRLTNERTNEIHQEMRTAGIVA